MKLFLLSTVVILGGLFVVLLPPKASAAQTIISCSSLTSNSYYDVLSQQITGNIYLKLPATGTNSEVGLYSENLTSNTCQLIGLVGAKTTEWTLVGSTMGVTNLLLQGQALGAEPYAAVAQLLVLPFSDICAPTITCQTNYQGLNGSLVPNIISNTTDQIAVYQASPITNIPYKNINYFSDGILLYSSDKLTPINRDYLSGGTHQVSIQVNFTNSEKFVVNQTINLGADWSGVLQIRSDFYNSHSKIVFVGIIFGVLLVAGLLLETIRGIYHRHQFKVEHGLSHYKDSKNNTSADSSKENKTIVG